MLINHKLLKNKHKTIQIINLLLIKKQQTKYLKLQIHYKIMMPKIIKSNIKMEINMWDKS